MNCPVGGEPLHPDGGSGRRLIELMGRDAFDRFDRMNVLDETTWRPDRARASAAAKTKLLAGRKVAVLGAETWRALTTERRPRWLQKTASGDSEFTLIPHPSGRNLVLNSRDMRRAVRRTLREMAGLR
jgi:hypothetical protein